VTAFNISWVKDKQAEDGMRTLGIHYDEVQVTLDKIDLAEGVRRQVRLVGRLDDNLVEQYAMAWAGGARFPMPILGKMPRGAAKPYYTVSGNHRLGALDTILPVEDKPQTVVAAYAVNLSGPALEILPRVVNCWVGRGLSTEERVINAQYLVEKLSMTTADAARLFGLKTDQINTQKRADDTKKKLAALGVAAGLFTKTLLLELAKEDNVNAMKAAAVLIQQNKSKGDEALQIVRDVRAQKTEAKKLGEVGRWEKTFADRSRPRRDKDRVSVPFAQPIKRELLRSMTSLAKVLMKGDSLDQLQLFDPADIRSARDNAKKIVAKLIKVFQGSIS
jgi:hypothetical protein